MARSLTTHQRNTSPDNRTEKHNITLKKLRQQCIPRQSIIYSSKVENSWKLLLWHACVFRGKVKYIPRQNILYASKVEYSWKLLLWHACLVKRSINTYKWQDFNIPASTTRGSRRRVVYPMLSRWLSSSLSLLYIRRWNYFFNPFLSFSVKSAYGSLFICIFLSPRCCDHNNARNLQHYI